MSSENLPQVAEEQDTKVDAPTAAWLRADNIVKAINANLPEGFEPLKPIPEDYVFHKPNREVVSLAMHSAFQLIGGQPRFVAWAAANPEKFYNLYVKLLPTETVAGNATNITINTAIPETPQDRITLDAQGKAVDAEYSEIDDEDGD